MKGLILGHKLYLFSTPKYLLKYYFVHDSWLGPKSAGMKLYLCSSRSSQYNNSDNNITNAIIIITYIVYIIITNILKPLI